MFRYYSIQRPVTPGSFPKKPGCVISNYPEKFYVSSAAVNAWGHIDYTEPLTDAEIKNYELQPERYEFTVTYTVDHEQIRRLHALLPHWLDYVDEETGNKPFTDYDLAKLFQVIMQAGSFHTINEHISSEEYRQGVK